MDGRVEQKLTLEDLVVLNRSAVLARLLSGVAHEVNNALQVIGGSVELLEKDPTLPPSAAVKLTRIHKQQARAAAVIGSLLTFAREGADGRGSIDLREVVSQAVALRTYAAGRAGIRINMSPPADEALSVHGNRRELQQAVLNLIANAEQALAGVPGAQIDVRLETLAGCVVLRVEDNGPGVPPDLAERIFEPFFTTRRGHDASGLGLAVVRSIAERSEGTISFEPRRPGAAFVLRLPAASRVEHR